MYKLRFLIFFIFLCVFGCDENDNPIQYSEVVWSDLMIDDYNIIENLEEKEMRIFNIEYVSSGSKAIWPTTDSYFEPTKPGGYLFNGWDFDWQNTPITKNTDIHAKWIKGDPKPTECVSTVDNSGIDHPLDGPDNTGVDSESDFYIDSIRSNFETTEATPLDDWITAEKIKYSSEITEQHGFTGYFRYTVATNTGPRRIGRIKITTPGTEIADPYWWSADGADGVKTFCVETITYIVQKAGNDTPQPEPLDDFTALIQAFSTQITIPENGTTYNYLHDLYNEADAQFHNNSSLNGIPKLYLSSNFPFIYDYYGSTSDEDKAFKTMVGWLFAMQLSELKPTKRNELYKIGYEYGGYDKNSNMYGYQFRSDPNVARLVASAVYSTMRSKKSPNITTMRTEVGGSTFSNNLKYYSETEARDKVGTNDFFIDLRTFMPTAPGPYLSGYTDRSSIGGIPFPNESKNSDYNLSMDLLIYNHIVENYNIDGTYHQRTVQAIADKETDSHHLFGTSKTVSSYTFDAVFPNSVLGKNINADIVDKFCNFTYWLGNIGSRARTILQSNQYYGRRRPGQGITDGSKKSTSDDRYNVLVNFYIEDNDGRKTGYYDINGNWVYPDIISSPEEYNEYMKKQLYANSYPSGHSSFIWSLAMSLMEIFPDHADNIIRCATNFAVNRTVARYHWNSDTINGRVLGSAINAVAHAASDYDSYFAKAIDDIN